MRDVSHKTWIAIVLDHVNAWRKANGWSRETVVQLIVEAHERTNGPVVTGIKFEPHTADTFERWKVNADRVFRWLDDSSKDTNLLPTNFIPSILSAMPMDVRLHCMDDLLRGVVIEHRDALEVIERYDTESTLIYADPPYVFSTRTGIQGRTKSTQGYRHEMSDDEHRKLAEVLHAAKGMVVLSGYPSDLYDNDLYADWERFERRHVADGGLFRTEVVWINQACVEALSISRGGLF